MHNQRAFEIVYADGSVVAGSTAAKFRDAPEGDDYADDAILFVIIEHRDGSVTKFKGSSTYQYKGVDKRGGWADRKRYDDVKASLPEISALYGNR